MYNGTEALNKALDTPRNMPRCKCSMNISSLVSLLVETFFYQLLGRNVCLLILQNRPQESILHCLGLEASSNHYTSNDIFVADDKAGIFEVVNTKGFPTLSNLRLHALASSVHAG